MAFVEMEILERKKNINLLVCFVVGTISILFGAVQPWVWSVYVMVIFVAFLLMFWGDDSLAWKPGILFISTIVLFLSLTLLQCLPLPPGIMASFSPLRYQELVASRAIIDMPLRWATISYDPLTAFGRWVFFLSLFLFFLVLIGSFRHSRNLERLVWVLLGVATLQALYGLAQTLIPEVGVLWVESAYAGGGNARGTFINRNHFAGFMEMAWPLGLGVTLALGGWEKKNGIKAMLSSQHINYQLLFLLMVVMMLLSLLFSRSRAGIAGALIGFLTFIWLIRRGTQRFKWGFRAMTCIILLLLGAYGSQIGFESIIERFLQIDTENSRLDVWRDSLGMVPDHFWGVGLQNYQFLSPFYLDSIVSTVRYTHAHNDYLQFLIEAGWIGSAALVAGFLTFLVISFGKMKMLGADEDRFRFFVAAGALSGLVSIAFHSLFDFNLQIPANTIYFVVLIGLVHSCLWEGKVHSLPAGGCRKGGSTGRLP